MYFLSETEDIPFSFQLCDHLRMETVVSIWLKHIIFSAHSWNLKEVGC